MLQKKGVGPQKAHTTMPVASRVCFITINSPIYFKNNNKSNDGNWCVDQKDCDRSVLYWLDNE